MAAGDKEEGFILEVRGLVKTFPGVRALDRVHFDLRKGEVHALAGENGAGKSTLIHILGGIYPPDEGRIFLGGRPADLPDPHRAALEGISVVFQDLSLSDNLSVAENLFANRQPLKRFGLIDRGRLGREARDLLRLFDLSIDPATPVKELSPAEQQVIEILKAVSLKPRVLIMDEPTSSLTVAETELLFKNVERWKQAGMSLIYVSHHLPEIFRLADRVTVLRDGRHVETCRVRDLTEEGLVRKMVGRELQNLYGIRRGGKGEECLRVEGAGRGKAFDGVRFSLARGEILGLAGLAGSGRTELGRGLFGAEPLDRGEVFLDGAPVRIRAPREAIALRIAYLTEDRKEQGLFLDMAFRANGIAPSLDRHASRVGLMDEKAITRTAEAMRRRFNIVTPDIRQKVQNLSGGNQQKALLAMWIGIEPRVLIVDEPTRGVDVGARADIYRHLRALAEQGAAILLISSDLLEILGLSDRILVMRNGRVAGAFGREEATEERLIACATGLY